MIHLALNVEDAILSMNRHCRKGRADRHRWTGRQSETDTQTDRQRNRDIQINTVSVRKIKGKYAGSGGGGRGTNGQID